MRLISMSTVLLTGHSCKKEELFFLRNLAFHIYIYIATAWSMDISTPTLTHWPTRRPGKLGGIFLKQDIFDHICKNPTTVLPHYNCSLPSGYIFHRAKTLGTIPKFLACKPNLSKNCGSNPGPWTIFSNRTLNICTDLTLLVIPTQGISSMSPAAP